MRLLLLFTLFVSFTLASTGQIVEEYPQSFLSSSFNTFINTHELRNSDSSLINLSTYIRKNTGLFSDVYQTNTQVAYFRQNSTTSAQFYSDRQGDLISRNRMYIHYNYRVHLTGKLVGFAGLGAGLVNKSLGNSTTTSQGVATVFDASATAGIYSPRMVSAFSINQIPQSNLKPMDYSVSLRRYYQLYVLAEIASFSEFSLTSIIMWNGYPMNQEFIGGLQIALKKQYKLGMELSTANVVNYFVDVKVYSATKYTVATLLSYETSHRLSKQMNGTLSIFNCGFVLKRI